MKFSFEQTALDQYNEWALTNRKIFVKITRLIQETGRTPFTGTGKPEALKGNLSGYWSRRITDEHRLIYRVTDDAIIINSCKGHYE
jgi:toxin YoeB